MRRMLRMSTVVVGVVTAQCCAGVLPARAVSGGSIAAVWDGGGDGTHFADAANWVGDAVPDAGSAVDLSAAACSARTPLDNDLPGGLEVSDLTTPTAWCTITGATISLAGTVHASGLELRTPLALTGDSKIATGIVRTN